MTSEEIHAQIISKKSFLCVGLDTDIEKIPSFLKERYDNPILAFNKRIIDATKSYCVAYKINTAFYESMGSKGWDTMQETVSYIPDEIFTIADAKRGDIGNTCNMYAKAFFENMNFDAVTISPYMGKDSVTPFLAYKDKWVIILALTSNESSRDFQLIDNTDGKLYEQVLEKASKWGNENNIMFVVGATKAEAFKGIRDIAPNNFLLVPGVGAQGGSLKEVAENGINEKCGLLINSSRGIIYAGDGEDFDQKAGMAAKTLQEEMSEYLT